MTKTKLLPALAAACVLAGLAAPAAAAVITPVGVEATNTFPFWNQYRAENLIDGSGMVGDLHDSNYANMWMTDLSESEASLTFDLGGLYQLSGLTVWNYNFGVEEFASTLDRAAKAFTLEVSADGLTFTQALSGEFARGTGQLLAGESFGLAGLGRYVRLNLSGNHQPYPEWYGVAPVGLSEVRFEGVMASAVPEPGTWTLMIAGVGLAGAALRRRRNLALA